MSKYALKLEQLVQTDAYGDILITIQYDGQGPKIVSATGDSLDQELKHQVDTVLGLVNFALTKQITPAELADQLEAEPQDGVHLPLNDLLLVIASALKDAPMGVNKINADNLMEIVPDMVKQFTQGVGNQFAPTQSGEMPTDQMNDDQRSSANPNQGQPQPQPANASQNEASNTESGEPNKKSGFFGGFNRN